MKPHSLFAILIFCQAAHSIEETLFALYDWLPYIRWADEIFSTGALALFVFGNVAFVLFGCWCYLARVKTRAANAGFFVMLWAVIEILNGILHPAWSLIAGRYVPGTATAPVLFVLGVLLIWRWNATSTRDLPSVRNT